MPQPRLYPLTFTPVLRDYIWGGRRLEALYGRRLSPGIVAESWEISGHPSAPTFADAGCWQGQPLPAILAELGEELVGGRAGWALQRHKFPLLVKLLDAHQDLSVQVHPDDAYALAHENGELGKTEMWYVLHADPGAGLILGVRPGTTRDAFEVALRVACAEGAGGGRQMAHDGVVRGQGRPMLDTVLQRVPIRAGQAVFIPTGTVHALLAGTVVAEIQQNSDATYRVYDWGRVAADGEPRPLHIAKALEVIDFDRPHPGPAGPRLLAEGNSVRWAGLVRSRYFVVEEVTLAPGARYVGRCDGATLEIWGCVAGQAAVEWGDEPVSLPAIRWALLPAGLGEFSLTAREQAICLRVYLPEESAMAPAGA